LQGLVFLLRFGRRLTGSYKGLWRGRLSLLLLLLGEFQSVAEDFESRLLIIESTCLGRFTADTEHLLPPGGEKTRH
jgi:hypothetical protein